MPQRRTEYIDLAVLTQIVPSYSREEELLRWERNGPSGNRLASLPSDPPDLVLRYAEHADGVIDLFLPPGPPAPTRLIFAVHGGSFRAEWDRNYLRHLARLLNQHRLVVALPEFRRVGGLGGWPAIALDVEDAMAQIRPRVAAVAPGWTEAEEPLVVLGHSSGGHLGAWAGLRAGPTTVSGIVAVAPSFELEFNARVRKHNGYIQDLLGGEPDEVPEAYREADIYRLATGQVPMTLIQGTEDLQLTVEASRRAAAKLTGVPGFTYVEVEGADHFDLVNPEAPPCLQVLLPILTAGARPDSGRTGAR